ncbi:MAG: hypothetical protein JWR19_1740 [Pedosphaera sp.]|nr:hypothetical protein [Pedosphaera sp.]
MGEMMMGSPDNELVKAYAAEGSETAFRALVARHVDLVYATAMRQVGDAGVAEEVAQNVFMALARKAPRLGGMETLGGWLHRTAIFEAKARIRAELRRRRREETAAELVAMQREGASPLAAMIPLLDEGLLSLRDGDRLALVLRFLEERSLREVGTVLGVDEDAARKRISRALERLTRFFRQRGLTIPGDANSAALLADVAMAAPAGVATACANAGLTMGGAATGLNLALFKLMTLTKTQTLVLCAVVALAPLAWQWQAAAGVAREQAEARAQRASAGGMAMELENNLRQTRASVERMKAETATNELRLAELNTQIEGRAPAPVYQWDDASPVVRVPKQLLGMIPVAAVSSPRGQLSEQIKEVLQLTDAETQRVQEALDRFKAEYNAAQAVKIKRVEPSEQDLRGGKPEETRVFEVPAIGDKMGEMRQALFGELEATLGTERFQGFRSALEDWMPVDDEERGINSGMGVFNFDHRMIFRQPQPGSQTIKASLSRPNGQWMSEPTKLEDIPEIFRAQLQDWITIAQTKPAKN